MRSKVGLETPLDSAIQVGKGNKTWPPSMTDHQQHGATEPKTVLIDARGLSCPLPLLEARRALHLLARGAALVVLTTDPAAPADFADFALARDLDLDETRHDDGSFRLTLRPPAM